MFYKPMSLKEQERIIRASGALLRETAKEQIIDMDKFWRYVRRENLLKNGVATGIGAVIGLLLIGLDKREKSKTDEIPSWIWRI